MRILGIDPGTARLGYAVVDAEPGQASLLNTCGVIKTDKGLADAVRLAEIRYDLATLIEKFKPEVMVVEKLFFFKNLKTIIPVAQARGVILELAGSYKIPVYEFTPLQVKQIITGQGRAEKQLVAELVKREFNMQETISSDDAADAVAIALCYQRSVMMQVVVQN
jgi:crossover junction endodeoxyribonuclease RuvC